MYNLSKIEVIHKSEYTKESPVISRTFSDIISVDLTEQSVSTDYDILVSVPQQMTFKVEYDKWLDTIANYSYWIRELNIYFVRALDYDGQEIFRGFIKKGDIKRDIDGNTITIIVNDMLVLAYNVADVIIPYSTIVSEELYKASKIYAYYMSLMFSEYFTQDMSGYYSIDDSIQYQLDTVKYKETDNNLKSMLNVFLNINRHCIVRIKDRLVFTDMATPKRIKNYTVISQSDIFNANESSMMINSIKETSYRDLLDPVNDQLEDQYELLYSLNIFNTNRVNKIISRRMSVELSNLTQQYQLELNDYIQIGDSRWSVRSLKKYANHYELTLWNSSNPSTSIQECFGHLTWDAQKTENSLMWSIASLTQ